MARPSVSSTIDGFQVTTTKLSPMSALKLAPKLGKIMTPLLGVQAALAGGQVEDLVPTLTMLLGTLDDATMDMLCRDLLQDTTITAPDDNGKASVWELSSLNMVDIAFGKIDDGLATLVRTLVFVAEVNFKRSFFALTEALGMKRKPPAAPTTPVA